MYSGEVNADNAALRYALIYCIGNFSIGTWLFFWNAKRLHAANAFVILNTFCHLFAVSQLPPINNGNRLTHIIAKCTAGIGMLGKNIRCTIIRFTGNLR